VLVLRETPLHLGHIRQMAAVAEAGGVIFPPVPAFYARPQTVDDIIDNTVGRVLFRMGVDNDLFLHWQGLRAAALARRAAE
jgi:4-hydroxy-3-polyprenylbenzoate decarboxylase